MSKYYQAYGLTFQSDIELFEFSTTISKPEIFIKEVDALSESVEFDDGRMFRAFSEKLFVQHIPEVGDFLVKDGIHIEFVRHHNCEDQEIRLFLTGSIIGALLQQRGFLTLHASSISTERGAVLFMGRSGAGKSTLLNAMLKRGFKMLSDDITAIQVNKNDIPYALSAFPRSKLWQDSANKLDCDFTQMERCRKDINKYNVPVDEFCNDNVPVYQIFLLSSYNKNTIIEDVLNAYDSFFWLQKNTYRKRFVRGNDLMRNQFDIINKLINKIEIVRLTRPIDVFLMDELVDVVVNRINEKI